jgi:2'-5' RNA ligase
MEKKYSDGSHVCIVVPVPPEVAKGIEDPHVTVLYIGEVPKEKKGILINAVTHLFDNFEPVSMEYQALPKISYFEPSESSDGKRVAKVDITATHLEALHNALCDTLEDAGIEIEHTHDYSPHLTVGYVEPDTEYQGEVPQGSWGMSGVELWGYEEPIKFPHIPITDVVNNVVAAYTVEMDGTGLAQYYSDTFDAPVVYDSKLRNEATTRPNKIIIGPDFVGRDRDVQDYIISHEFAHYKKLDDIALADPKFWDLVQLDEMFGPLHEDGSIDGINGQYTPGENVAEAYALYITEPAWLKSKYPKAYNWISDFSKHI